MSVAHRENDGELITIEQVRSTMVNRLEWFEQRGDHRAVFQRVYLLMTTEMQRRLASSFFLDGPWMERVLVTFARYYFDAVGAYDAGRRCPPAWRLAFDSAAGRNIFVLQDALLGINAHINNDLAFVLRDLLQQEQAWPDARVMLRRRRDHDRVNEVLHDLVDLAQAELSSHYARFVGGIEWAMGRKDETLASIILGHCRTNVWQYAELLLDAPTAEEERLVEERIEQAAYQLAEQVTDARLLRWTRRLAPISRRWRLF